MNKIGIAIPIYLRGKATNKHYESVIRYYSTFDVLIHICGSEGKLSRAFSEPFLNDRVKYFEILQKEFTMLSRGDDYLRLKFNQSLRTFRKIELDLYCLAGADDIASPEFMKSLLEFELTREYMPTILGVQNRAFELIIVPDDEPPYAVDLSYSVQLLPGINCFNPAAMRVSHWKPYQLQGCETGAEKYFADCGLVIGLPGSVYMLKGDDVLNSSKKIKRMHTIIPARGYHITELENITLRIAND